MFSPKKVTVVQVPGVVARRPEGPRTNRRLLPSEYKYGDAAHYARGSKYADPITSSVQKLPAWMNRGEAGIPDWMDLSESNRAVEKDGLISFDAYWSDAMMDFGSFPENILLESGKKLQAQHDHRKKSPEEQKAITKVKKDEIKAEYHPTRSEPSRELGVRKPFWGRAKKNIYKGKSYEEFITEGMVLKEKRVTKAPKKSARYREFKEWYGKTVPSSTPTIYERGFWSDFYRGEVTYEKVKEWFANPSIAPEVELGEQSLVHFYENFLKGNYAWAPDDTTITKEILPDRYLEGMENSFKPLLAEISEDPVLRKRADALHNAVHRQDTQEYLSRYHPNSSMTKNELAKDAAGTSELFSDWSESYEGRMNKVRFNGHLHQQISFGVGEDV